MKEYNHKDIEKKWQNKWAEDKIFETKDEVVNKENEYILVEFPYPSGNLHVGHWYAFAVTDIYARYRRMLGKNVLFPIGFDAFGLPAENAAIKNKINPRDWTYSNIEYMEKQLANMGTMFDWSKKIVTSDPEYYKWTQWLFLKLLQDNLAYQSENYVNWCPSCKTVLANEQVKAGKCERCESDIEQKIMKEWKLRITNYAQKLLDGLEKVDWPSYIKDAQRNWIGKSDGTYFTFKIDDSDKEIKVFTTRADTYYGITYLVLAPENKLVDELKDKISNFEEVEKYRKITGSKTELQRVAEVKEKTGVKLEGITAIHPANGKEISVFISDYVIASYGTGAVMAVPAHDERDFEFAQKFNLPVEVAIEPITGTPLENEENRESIVAYVENKKTYEVLSINWGESLGGNLLIGGGIEGTEDLIECAKREIREETGYKNVKFVAQSEAIHHHYRAHSKNVNRNIKAIGLHFELVDEEREEQKLEENEKNKFIVEWVSKEKLDQLIKDPLHHYLFSKFAFNKIFIEDGIVTNSAEFNGQNSIQAREQITSKFGEKTTNYRIRDWSVSRQRYWGCPIPVIHCEKCGAVPVEEKDLPVVLPDLEDFTPRDDGKSPLAKAEDWIKVKCPKCEGEAMRETDTLDTFIDSSWYFLRYIDPKNDKEFSSKEKQKNWMPVNFYSGGSEHTTMHLLYARFFQKALFDLGLVNNDEPFLKRNNRGLILNSDGSKMSKSKGTVVNPDEWVERLGADTVRSYLAFMGPYNEAGSYPWDPNGVVGVRRFIERVFALQDKISDSDSDEVTKLLHKTIKGVTEDYQALKFNTALSKLMILSNLLEKEKFSKETYKTFVQIFSPITPHACEELWYSLGETKPVVDSVWPSFDEAKLQSDEIEIAVQINGKFRFRVNIDASLDDKEVKEKVQGMVQTKKWLGNKRPDRVVYIKGRIINLVLSE